MWGGRGGGSNICWRGEEAESLYVGWYQMLWDMCNVCCIMYIAQGGREFICCLISDVLRSISRWKPVSSSSILLPSAILHHTTDSVYLLHQIFSNQCSSYYPFCYKLTLGIKGSIPSPHPKLDDFFTFSKRGVGSFLIQKFTRSVFLVYF